MAIVVVAEKPSAARNWQKALGLSGKEGTYKGQQVKIANLRGHLYELAQPEDQVPPALKEQYKSWDLSNLPWDHRDMSWKTKPQEGTSAEIKALKAVLPKADEIVIATDLDPSGEGFFYALVAEALNVENKRHSRAEFVDESAPALAKAFDNRRAIKSFQTEREWLKATYRSRWDFLSMQFTRSATVNAAQRAVLRQGRLKSAMLLLVGDQLKAYNDYVKKPFFQNRFQDENGVIYTNPDEPRFDTKNEVPQNYRASRVTPDSRVNKSVKPPRLLDLAGLSARLSSKSYTANTVLQTYQKMYEAQIVSYPRTEDKHITTEQFKEMLPLVDQISRVVGVDTSILTERAPRKTHVKDSGAHGANRPGLNVPRSLEDVEGKYGKLGALIYEELARSFLAMFAKDYVYEAQEGHVSDYPKFIGRAQVPKVMGWKEVFNTGDDKDEDENAKGLGSRAEPIVFEGANKRPEHPTMKWLMKQLERREVGTGATRTSTYAEVTNQRTKYPLMVDKRGKITFTEYGDMGYRMLPGTKIGDLSATEQVFATMERIANGETTIDAELGVVADWVRHDIPVMEKNAEAMRKELGLSVEQSAQRKEKAEGYWVPAQDNITFSREWSGHRFTDAEVEKLLAGDEIEFEAVSSRTGNTFTARGKLEKQKYSGNTFIGFKPDFGPKKGADGKELPPDQWCKVKFTDAEKQSLAAGQGVKRDDFVSKAGKNFAATVHWKKEKGAMRIVPSFG